MKRSRNWFLALVFVVSLAGLASAEGVFVRMKLVEPKGTAYFVRLGGYIHKSPWYLPKGVLPVGADRDAAKRVAAGEFTPWLDVKKYAGDRLHGRMSRSGGIAEWPNVTAEFVTTEPSERQSVVIELANAPHERHVVKRFTESFRGTKTSLLVSPNLTADAEHLETASQMTERRLRWAREATGGKAATPKQLIVQTNFWSPQREELNLREAEVLRLLGFNVVGNQSEAVRREFDFRVPGHTHSADFSPKATRQGIEASIAKQAPKYAGKLVDGVPFGLSDEICCRKIGKDETALRHFHEWLQAKKIPPKELGTSKIKFVVPIEEPDDLRARQKINRPAANRVFYYTSRFRQEATTERFRWLSESLHRHLGGGVLTSTLVADHPYFSGTGLGMGMGPNPCWGRAALAADWFGLVRERAVDLIGIEDWMGLQFMYGPNTTWEGFQLMGFQAAMMRSGGQGRVPIIAWITPSDETNLRLKSASSLCQGAKHFFYWTYGPTATSTENYWSDLRGSYDGIAHVTRQLAAAEHILAPGKMRKTRVALLYSISSDLWQPFGYVHMLERRGTYLSLVHDQYLVDMLTEEDIDAGRLRDYDVLYATDPCIKPTAIAQIDAWVRGGGRLYGTCAAGSRNEYNEPIPGLAKVFGIDPEIETKTQPGQYHIRGALNGMKYLDKIQLKEEGETKSIGVIGVRTSLTPTTGTIVGTFANGAPAAIRHSIDKGETLYVAACPAIAYIKEAKFVRSELKEKWPPGLRSRINEMAGRGRAGRVVELSHPVVEAGVYDSDRGTVLVLGNFTYEPIERLEVRLALPRPPKGIHSAERGVLKFGKNEVVADSKYPHRVRFTLALGISDVVIVE